ncbi:hypothetical protein HN587_02665 [Candidatus Woesearchaeota archaeon]|jgi:hypothetical protein|nr:hypothetical protein [Candidatus Woesearchaeota archaeon]
MGLSKKKEEKPVLDFIQGYNNNVAAVYVCNPEILEMDDPTQRGKPFLFYLGRSQSNLPAHQIGEGWGKLNPYAGKGLELEKLLEGRNTRGHLPETVVVNGETIESKTLGSGYVPFSFGVGHRYDVERWEKQGSPTVRLDLDAFKQVLVKYDQMKAEEAKRKSKLGYKVKKLFGFAD